MISVAQSFSNSRKDLQDVTAVTPDLLACFASKIVAQKQLVNCLAFSLVFQNEIIASCRLDYEYEIEYEYDFSILVFRLHINTARTQFI